MLETKLARARAWHRNGSVLGMATGIILGATQARAATGGTGVEVGLRAGLSFPFGKVMDSSTSSNDLSKAVAGVVPLLLDANYRITPNIGLGLYGQYGFGILSHDQEESCDSGNADCSISQIRLGLQASYIVPLDSVDVWGGLTLGYERLKSSVENTSSILGSDISSTLVTLPEFGLQVGTSFKHSSGLAVGPVLGFTFGRFSWGNLEIDGRENHMHIKAEDRGFHEWLTLAVRVSYAP